jgi:hypothetical protein
MNLIVVALLALLALPSARGDSGITAYPLLRDLTCGRYTLTGELASLPTGVDLLKIHPGTQAEFSVVIRGLPAKQSLAYEGTRVRIVADILRKADLASRGLIARYVSLEPRASHAQVVKESAVKLKDLKCAPAP